jgi:hypothetical protein
MEPALRMLANRCSSQVLPDPRRRAGSSHKACEYRAVVTVEDAFRRARKHSVEHMAACEKAHLRWGETAVTEIVMSRAAVAVSVVPFSQRAEAVSGADWV